MAGYVSPPPKPKRMSQKRYRELYDSRPCVVTAGRTRITTAGAVSAEVIARSYRRDGVDVTIGWADDQLARHEQDTP